MRLRPEVKRLNLSLPHVLFLTQKVRLSYTLLLTIDGTPFTNDEKITKPGSFLDFFTAKKCISVSPFGYF